MDRWRPWIEPRLGTSATLTPAGRPDGEAEVWRVDGAEGDVAYLKVHRVADKWRREHAILERLAASPAAAMVPRVLAADRARRALLLTAVPGRGADRGPWTLTDRRAMHEQAGRFRAVLDDLPLDDVDPLSVVDALTRRHRAWCERARPSLDPELLQRAEHAFDPACLAHVPRRWCHRDLGPHNWIVQTTERGLRLGVIDFGQARPDPWWVDVLKLWDDAWLEHPSLEDAFWRGYGRRPDARERQQLHPLALLHGLATAVWGDHHGHPELSRRGRAILRRVLEQDWR